MVIENYFCSKQRITWETIFHLENPESKDSNKCVVSALGGNNNGTRYSEMV